MSFSSDNPRSKMERSTAASSQGFDGKERLPNRTQQGTVENRPCRVLIVDDNAAAVKMLSLMMKLLGNEVRTAKDGQQGVETAAEFLPDLMLLDISMPRMNGYEAARHIREQPWGERIMLVAVSGWGDDEDKRRSSEAGFDHHLVKPADCSILERLLHELNF